MRCENSKEKPLVLQAGSVNSEDGGLHLLQEDLANSEDGGPHLLQAGSASSEDGGQDLLQAGWQVKEFLKCPL